MSVIKISKSDLALGKKQDAISDTSFGTNTVQLYKGQIFLIEDYKTAFDDLIALIDGDYDSPGAIIADIIGYDKTLRPYTGVNVESVRYWVEDVKLKKLTDEEFVVLLTGLTLAVFATEYNGITRIFDISYDIHSDTRLIRPNVDSLPVSPLVALLPIGA